VNHASCTPVLEGSTFQLNESHSIAATKCNKLKTVAKQGFQDLTVLNMTRSFVISHRNKTDLLRMGQKFVA